MREYGEETRFICLKAQTWAMKQSSSKDFFIAQLGHRPGISNTWPKGRMWPARVFCAARHVFLGSVK